MDGKQRTAESHKTTTKGTKASDENGKHTKKKLSKTVEDFAVNQQSFPEGVVELSEEKSSQKPPADTTVLTRQHQQDATDNDWKTVNRNRNNAMTLEDTVENHTNPNDSTPKRKGNNIFGDVSQQTTDRKKRFQPRSTAETKAQQALTEANFKTAAEMMKERGAEAIDATTEVVTPVTIEFLIPAQTKVFHIRDAFV